MHERLEKAPLVKNLGEAQSEVKDILERLGSCQLLDEVSQTFRGKTVRFTKSWAILHSVQHTAYHLGQIQLFKKIATSAGGVEG